MAGRVFCFWSAQTFVLACVLICQCKITDHDSEIALTALFELWRTVLYFMSYIMFICRSIKTGSQSYHRQSVSSLGQKNMFYVSKTLGGYVLTSALFKMD